MCGGGYNDLARLIEIPLLWNPVADGPDIKYTKLLASPKKSVAAPQARSSYG
jgi:hypothetical protein